MACTCGHSEEEHGHDPKFSGAMGCSECGCINFEEADDDFGEDYDDGYDADLDPEPDPEPDDPDNSNDPMFEDRDLDYL